MIIYITRKFPPSIGGMQRFNAKLVEHLKGSTQLCVISWGRSQLFLPLFIVYAFAKTVTIGTFHKISCIYVSDGLLSPLAYWLKTILGKPAVCTIHGRDIAFSFGPYQYLIPRSLARLDQILCVSEQLKQECIKRKVPEAIIRVIPNGVDLDDFRIQLSDQQREHFESLTGQPLKNRRILISVGRLTPKKGIDAFINNTLPIIVQHNKDVIYLIAGEGPLRGAIEQSIRRQNLEHHAFLLGKIGMDSAWLPALYNLAHVFIMPNVKVEGDMEGFGIVTLEAGAASLPVVASNVDGIAQAVSDRQNGFLIDGNNHEQFAQTVLRLINDEPFRKDFGQAACRYVEQHYSWPRIAEQYAQTFKLLGERE